MNASEILVRVRATGARLAAKEGKLLVNAPRGAITPILKAALIEHKEELLQMLAANDRHFPGVWSCRVDGVTFTAIDPSRKPDEEMIRRFRLQFGARFEHAERVR